MRPGKAVFIRNKSPELVDIVVLAQMPHGWLASFPPLYSIFHLLWYQHVL